MAIANCKQASTANGATTVPCSSASIYLPSAYVSWAYRNHTTQRPSSATKRVTKPCPNPTIDFNQSANQSSYNGRELNQSCAPCPLSPDMYPRRGPCCGCSRPSTTAKLQQRLGGCSQLPGVAPTAPPKSTVANRHNGPWQSQKCYCMSASSTPLQGLWCCTLCNKFIAGGNPQNRRELLRYQG